MPDIEYAVLADAAVARPGQYRAPVLHGKPILEISNVSFSESPGRPGPATRRLRDHAAGKIKVERTATATRR